MVIGLLKAECLLWVISGNPANRERMAAIAAETGLEAS
jgi:hypothetical protein